MPKELVIHDHDGGIDDYLSLALLLTMDNIETIGVVVTPADCYIKPAVSVTRKLLDLMGFSHITVGESTVRGLNPFPRVWRQTAFAVDHFPLLNDRETITTPLAQETGQRYMAKLLAEAPEPVTILETGPLTTIAAALDIDPSLEHKIRRIVWMGGALNVRGNVDPVMEAGHDGSAEWNVYWDPPAAHQIWQTNIPLVICPLDLTNHVPVTSELVHQLSKHRRFPLAEFAALCYGVVIKGGYYFWDVLTTAYLGRPELYQLCEWETEIVVDGPSQGRTKVEAGGRQIMAMDGVDIDAFYAYISQQWMR
jgi:purine nucleosidase